jgi:hypothetical protein
VVHQRNPKPIENGNLIEQARAANPDLEIIARAHSDEEVEHLRKFGANLLIMGERVNKLRALGGDRARHHGTHHAQAEQSSGSR